MTTLRLTATVLDTPDPPALARFYRHLLGFETVSEDPDWVVLRGPDGEGLSVGGSAGLSREIWMPHCARIEPQYGRNPAKE